jgi:spermidine/putrescine transport system substrate-binding protein
MRADPLSRRTLLRAGLGAAAAALATPPRAHGQAKAPASAAPTEAAPVPVGPVLHLFTWEAYAPSALVEKFQQETGIKVTATTYTSNRELMTKLKANRSGYDVVQPTATLVPAGAREGYYQPIDPDRLRHASELMPSMLRVCDDSGGVLRGVRYALPFAWGAEGLSYDTRRLTAPPDSFGVLHDAAHTGRVSYRATVHAFLATGLWLGLGNRMRDVYVSEDDARGILDQVLDTLIEGKKLVRGYWSTAEEIEQWLTDGAVDVAQTWDATGWRLEGQGKPIRFVAPREGALAWMDTFVIPKEARNVQQAYAWIDFMYTPGNAAVFAAESGHSTVVTGARSHLPPAARRQLEASFPPRAVDNLWWYGVEHSWWPRVIAEYVEKLRAA